jgi:hypothetical protein
MTQKPKKRINGNPQQRVTRYLHNVYDECQRTPVFVMEPLMKGTNNHISKMAREMGILRYDGQGWYWITTPPNDSMAEMLYKKCREYNSGITQRANERKEKQRQVHIAEKVDYQQVGEQLKTNATIETAENTSEVVKQLVEANRHLARMNGNLTELVSKFMEEMSALREQMNFLYSQFK